MHEQPSTMDVHERLSAFFDGELDEQTRLAVEAELEREPELAEQLADLSFMRDLVVGDLEYQADRVPQARFEQIWDNFELTLERESRLQEAAEEPPSLWQRLLAWATPRRMPLATVGVVGALALVFAWSAGAPSEPSVATNTQDESASDATPDATPPQAEPAPIPVPGEDRLAAAPEPSPQVEPEVFPQPEPGEAEIRRIEFGGHVGTISQLEGTRGTTTVIWVTEDEAPVDSERSL